MRDSIIRFNKLTTNLAMKLSDSRCESDHSTALMEGTLSSIAFHTTRAVSQLRSTFREPEIIVDQDSDRY